MIKTIIGNFLKVAQNSGKFPVDADTLENFQNNTALTAALGAALGKNYVILTGCIKSGNNRSEGYVYVKLSASDPGEVLYFSGGNSNEPNCYVRADNTDVVAKGETYENAYTSRILSNGLPPHGEQKLAWNDFVTGSEIFAQKEHGHKISEVTDLQKSLDEKLPTTTYNTGLSKLLQKIEKLEKAVTAPAVTFIKGMIMIWKGSIVNIASVVGLIGNAGQANYSASKAGIIGFTKSVAREYALRGITVNAVAPGFIETSMTEVLKDEVKEEILKQVPLKRYGNTEDVANVVKFLVSDESSYITGQVINVDGGMLM